MKFKDQCNAFWLWLDSHNGTTAIDAALNPELRIGHLASRVSEMRRPKEKGGMGLPVLDKWITTSGGSKVKYYYKDRTKPKPVQLSLLSKESK